MKHFIILIDRRELGRPQKFVMATGGPSPPILRTTEHRHLARKFAGPDGVADAVAFLAGLAPDPRWLAAVVDEDGRLVVAMAIGLVDMSEEMVGSSGMLAGVSHV